MIGAVMPKSKAGRLGSGGSGHDLMAEAYAKQRSTVIDDGPGHRDGSIQARRITGPGRKDHAGNIGGEDGGEVGGVRQDAHSQASMDEAAHDV